MSSGNESGDDMPENGSNTDDEGNSDLDYEVNELMYNVSTDMVMKVKLYLVLTANFTLASFMFFQ